MLPSSAVDMVKRKKLVARLGTARTDATVVADHFFAVTARFQPLIRSYLFSKVTGAQFDPVCSHLGETFFSVASIGFTNELARSSGISLSPCSLHAVLGAAAGISMFGKERFVANVADLFHTRHNSRGD
jgi:hypothetical protein